MNNSEKIKQEEKLLPHPSSKRKYILITAVIAIIAGAGILVLLMHKEAPPQIHEIREPDIIADKVAAIPDHNLQTTKFASVSEGFENLSSSGFAFSSNGRQVAYREKDGEKSFIVLNGEEGKRYDEAWNPTFSADGKQFAYEAKDNEKEFIVLNGIEGKKYDYVSWFEFSSDGSQLAYIADDRDRESDKQEFIVLNGKELKGYTDINDFIFSPDRTQFAYIAEKHDEMQDDYFTFVVLNGKEGKGYDDIVQDMRFSPDGKKFVYVGVEETPMSEGGEYWVNKEYFVVIDGKEEKGYDDIEEIVFSPDSLQVAYVAQRAIDGDTPATISDIFYFVVTNGIEGKGYDDVSGLTFSSNGEQLVYVAEERLLTVDGWPIEYFVVVNGQEGKRSYDFPNLTFNSAGEFTFIARNGDDIAAEDEIQKAGRGYFIESIISSPDRSQTVYLIRSGLTHFVFLDGKQVHRSSSTIHYTKFSPDGKHLTFVDRRGGKYSVVIDGKPSQRYDIITDPIFSTDSKYITYGVRDGNELWWIVEDIQN